MAQGIHRDMDLGALAALVFIVAGARSTLRRRLPGAPVEDDGRGLVCTLGKFAQNHPQMVGHGLKTSGTDPTQRLLVPRGPRRQIVGKQAPRTARPDHPAKRLKDRFQRVFPLRSLLSHQGHKERKTPPPRRSHRSDSSAFPGRFLRNPKLAGPVYSQSTDLSAEAVRDTLYSESFNSRFRDEFLTRESIASVLEARVLGKEYRQNYSHSRPHSALDYETPVEFAQPQGCALPTDHNITNPNPKTHKNPHSEWLKLRGQASGVGLRWLKPVNNHTKT